MTTNKEIVVKNLEPRQSLIQEVTLSGTWLDQEYDGLYHNHFIEEEEPEIAIPFNVHSKDIVDKLFSNLEAVVSKTKNIVTFKWKGLSLKQKVVFDWWRSEKYKSYNAIIMDGAVRSGKTVSGALSFVDWALEEFDGQNFIFAGKTIGSFRRNVLEPLKQMMRGRRYKFKDHRSDNMIEIENPRNGHLCYFYIFGGKDEKSQDLVQGITAAGLFGDEVALMPESFVNQATARCSVSGAKFWFNCNPDGPYHWFKLNWIDLANVKKAFHLHFTMDDNPSLDEETKDRYKLMYSGVFYKRYILGLWVVAEGVIYDMFSEEKNVTTKHPFSKKEADRLMISIDYGIQNPMTFGKYGVKKVGEDILEDQGGKKFIVDRNHYHLYESYYHSGRTTGKQKTDQEYYEEFVKFVGTDRQKVKYVVVDPSASSFIVLLRKHGWRVIPARNSVKDGIALHMNLIERGLFTLDKGNTEDINEYYSYIWDADKILKGIEEPVKENDHCQDRNRYLCLTDSIVYQNRKVFSGKGSTEPQEQTPVHRVGTHSRI